MARALLNLAVSAALPDDYSHHPDHKTLLSYIQGTLPRGHRPELAADFARGQLTDWRQAEAGLHVKTCRRCWDQAVQLRMELRPEAARAVPSRELLRSRLSVRWAVAALPAALAAGFALGAWLHPWTSGSPVDVGQLHPTPLSSGGLGERQDLAQLLASGGLDLTPFDVQAPFDSYDVQPQDTLQSIALRQWGNAKHWIVIYVFNYQVLQSLDAPAQGALPLPLTLRLPLLLP